MVVYNNVITLNGWLISSQQLLCTLHMGHPLLYLKYSMSCHTLWQFSIWKQWKSPINIMETNALCTKNWYPCSRSILIMPTPFLGQALLIQTHITYIEWVCRRDVQLYTIQKYVKGYWIDLHWIVAWYSGLSHHMHVKSSPVMSCNTNCTFTESWLYFTSTP